MISSVTSRRARPEGDAVVPAGDLDRLPNATVTWTSLGRRGPDRLESLGAAQADRDDRDAGGQGEVGDAGAAAVEATVAGAGALGVDAERLAPAEHLQRGVEAGDRGLGVVAVDRQHAEPLEPRPLRRALEAGAGEVVGLGQEDDLARHHERDHHAVDEAQVVARQDHRAGGRHVLQAVTVGRQTARASGGTTWCRRE